MVGAVTGFLQGRQIRQQEDERLEARNVRQAQQRKAERFEGALGQLYQGTPYEGMAEFGQQGVAAVGQLQQYQAQQAKAQEEVNAKEFERIGGAFLNMNENQFTPDVKDQIFTELEDRGFDGAVLNQLYGMEFNQLQDVVAQSMGVERPQAARLPVSGIENVVMPDGSQESYDIGVPEERAAYQAAIEDGAKPQPTRSEVGGAGEFATDKQLEEMTNVEISTRQAIATANEILDMPEEAFQDAASLARVVSGMGAEVESMINIFGMEEGETLDSLTNAERYASKFEELGIESTVVQGLALDLAIAYASSIGLGEGRALSDKDVNRALERIGANGLRTPAARRAAIESVRGILDRNFRIRYETLMDKPYEGNLGIADTATDGGGIITITNDADYNELAPGAEFIDPNGERRIKP